MSGYQPLLTSDINEAIPSPYNNERRERHVVFAIDDDDDEDDRPLRSYADDERSPQLSNEGYNLPRVAPTLRSTVQSREAGKVSLGPYISAC